MSAAQHPAQAFQGDLARGQCLNVGARGLPTVASSDPVVADRSANGLRLVEVGRSDDGIDVVAVCDRHTDRWFSDVLPIGDAHDVVCIRCGEEERLQRRRVSILDTYGRAAWLRVLGRG